jgi:hypothetical protein
MTPPLKTTIPTEHYTRLNDEASRWRHVKTLNTRQLVSLMLTNREKWDDTIDMLLFVKDSDHVR